MQKQSPTHSLDAESGSFDIVPGSAEFIIGRDRFAQISAVEGIALTPDMQETLDRFDREGVSAADRRRAIVRRFTPAR